MNLSDYPKVVLDDGRTVHTEGIDHGPTVYTVTIKFSDEYCQRNPENGPRDNPWHWDWASMLDQPDARVITVQEERNLWWEQ